MVEKRKVLILLQRKINKFLSSCLRINGPSTPGKVRIYTPCLLQKSHLPSHSWIPLHNLPILIVSYTHLPAARPKPTAWLPYASSLLSTPTRMNRVNHVVWSNSNAQPVKHCTRVDPLLPCLGYSAHITSPIYLALLFRTPNFVQGVKTKIQPV